MCSINVAVYPASLSYHEKICAQSPSITFVRDKSTIAPYGCPIMSDDTSGSSVTERIFDQRGSPAAFVKIAFTSSGVVTRSVKTVIALKEPVIVGTRIANA